MDRRAFAFTEVVLQSPQGLDEVDEDDNIVATRDIVVRHLSQPSDLQQLHCLSGTKAVHHRQCGILLTQLCECIELLLNLRSIVRRDADRIQLASRKAVQLASIAAVPTIWIYLPVDGDHPLRTEFVQHAPLPLDATMRLTPVVVVIAPFVQPQYLTGDEHIEGRFPQSCGDQGRPSPWTPAHPRQQLPILRLASAVHVCLIEN